MSTSIQDWDSNSHHTQKNKTKQTGAQKQPPQNIDAWETHSGSQTGGDIFAHPEVSPELHRLFISNKELGSTFVEAIDRIKKEIDDVKVYGFLEPDMEDEHRKQPTLKIIADLESVDQWLELKSKVRSIVRDAESDETMIYTKIERE